MGLPDYVALHRDYARNGPPMRLILALYCGWKPPRQPIAAEIYEGEDLLNLIRNFEGGQLVAPPPETA